MADTYTGRHCTVAGCGEQLDAFDEGNASDFQHFGAGVVFYFKFLKWLGWTFLVLSFIYLPMIIINIQGKGIPDPAGLSLFSMTTIGNVGSQTMNSSSIDLPGCKVYNRILSAYFEDANSCSVDRNTLGRTYAWIDVVASVFLLFACYWLREFESIEKYRLENRTSSLSDYSIYVPWVPPCATEENMKEYFEKLARGYVKSDKHLTREINKHQKRKKNISKDMVVDVFIGYNNSELISACEQLGEEKFKKYRIGMEVRYWKTRLKKQGKQYKDVSCWDKVKGEKSESYITSSHRKRTESLQRIKQLEREIEEHHEKNTDDNEDDLGHGEPCSAFVTFKYAPVRDLVMKKRRHGILQRIFLRKCLPAFSPMIKKCLSCCLGDKKRLFQETYALRMKRAPDATTIVWENMPFRTFSRFTRRSITSVSCVFMISIAALIASCIEAFKREVDNSTLEEQENCEEGYHDDWTKDEKEEYITENTGYAHCYCNGISSSDISDYDVCQDYYKSTVWNLCISMGAVGVVVAVNTAITMMITKMAREFEKHHSLNGSEVSILNRAFFLKYLNSGCIYLIINYEIVKWITQKITGSGYDGPDENFNVEWYQDLAPLLIFLMLSNVVSPHLSVIYRYYTWRRDVSKYMEGDDKPVGEVQGVDSARKTDKIFCQDDINKKFIGPPFHLNFRYAQLLVNYYMAIMYSTGIPILIPIAVAQFFFTYWLDKFLFTNFYQQPPQYSSNVASISSKLCELGIGVHLVFAVWIISRDEIFNTGAQDKHERVEEFAAVYLPEEFFDTLGQNHVWPLTVFCVGFLAVTIAKELFQKVNHFLLKIFRLLACLPTEQVGYSEVRKLDCSYYEAKKRKRFGALSDYNILSNPRYQNAFKITAKWVREERKSQQIKGHRHLRSLRNFNREKSRGSFNGQEESKAVSNNPINAVI